MKNDRDRQRLDRRRLLAGMMVAGVVLAGWGPVALRSAQAASPDDPVTLVRSIYSKAAAAGATGLPERDFLALLSADLRRLWQTRVKLAGLTEAERLRAAVFGPGAGSGRSLAVKRVTIIPGLPKERIVAVEFTVGNDPRQVFVHLAPAEGGWTIVNIIYDEGDDFRRTAEQGSRVAG
ncbi:MAG: hypothetical protein HC900_11300 [Methylacidiphilales bacterium]|nr:hypothetical protein [Candidatus Methylacidiphilales bacterium]